MTSWSKIIGLEFFWFKQDTHGLPAAITHYVALPSLILMLIICQGTRKTEWTVEDTAVIVGISPFLVLIIGEIERIELSERGVWGFFFMIRFAFGESFLSLEHISGVIRVDLTGNIGGDSLQGTLIKVRRVVTYIVHRVCTTTDPKHYSIEGTTSTIGRASLAMRIVS